MDKIIQGDALSILKTLPDQCVQTCVTSPPYWGLRDYGVEGQLGLEEKPEEWVAHIVTIFREVWRVLKNNGTLWLNLGDCYAQSQYGRGGGWAKEDNKYDLGPAQRRSLFTDPGYRHGLKNKDLVGQPWRAAFALQADGWFLRQDIIWHKPNPMPESVTDRCTKAHEYIFLLSKFPQYYFDADAIKEPASYPHDDRKGRVKEDHKSVPDAKRNGLRLGRTTYDITKRNKRSVWTVSTKPYRGAHFATFPPDLVRPCILAGAPPQHTVLDPFMGSGTTAAAAKELHRHYLGIELNPAYIELAGERLGETRLQGVA